MKANILSNYQYIKFFRNIGSLLTQRDNAGEGVKWIRQVSVSKKPFGSWVFSYLFYLNGGALMGATPQCPCNTVGKKTDGVRKNKKKRVLHPLTLFLSLSLPLRSTERLIRTCHRSNEYHLNCFVYASEFGCRFNLRMCLSSCARRGGRRAAVLMKRWPR